MGICVNRWASGEGNVRRSVGSMEQMGVCVSRWPSGEGSVTSEGM